MNTKNSKLLFSLVAAIPLVVVGVQSPTANPSRIDVPDSSRIVELPAVRVRPDVEDVAYYQAHKIVDLTAVTVPPAVADQASFLAGLALRQSLACRC